MSCRAPGVCGKKWSWSPAASAGIKTEIGAVRQRRIDSVVPALEMKCWGSWKMALRSIWYSSRRQVADGEETDRAQEAE